MARKRIKGTKYSKVTKQQKYIFLKLCVSENQSIHQAAFHSGIHYSTAKTILFFHKKQYKNYTSYIINDVDPNEPLKQLPMALYKSIPINIDTAVNPFPRIEVISKICKALKKRNGGQKTNQTDGKKPIDEHFEIKLEDESVSKKNQSQQMKCQQKREPLSVKLEHQGEKYKTVTKAQPQLFGFFENK